MKKILLCLPMALLLWQHVHAQSIVVREENLKAVDSMKFPVVTVGSCVTYLVLINGASLSQDISVELPVRPAFSASATTAPQNANQFYLFIRYCPAEEEEVRDVLTFRSGAVVRSIPLYAKSKLWRDDLTPPANYYNSARGKSAAELKTSLYNIIKGHNEVTYANAWMMFGRLDVRSECDESMAERSIWDIYTDRPGCLPDSSLCTPGFVNPKGSPCSGFKVLRLGADQTTTGSSGSEEGKFYEREHSFPKSWWKSPKSSSGQYYETVTPYRDLHHLYPADKRVNMRRNNYPYGEVDSTITELFKNGSKLGRSTKAGTYKDLAFEPIDEYKGDLARTYFYMVTRYEHQIAHWSKEIEWGNATGTRNDIVSIKPIRRADACPMLDTNSYPVFYPWAHQMLLRWHRLDPVSDKERRRNQGIFGEQRNRNPYIDNPDLVEYIWGDSVGKPWGNAPIVLTLTKVERAEDGQFTVSVQVEPRDKIRSVRLFFGFSEGDTTQTSFSMSGSSGVYSRANVKPAFSYNDLYITVAAYDVDGNCGVVSYLYQAGPITSVASKEVVNFVVYPNPTHDEVYVRFEGDVGKVQLELYDLRGAKLKSKQAAYAEKLSINLQGLPEGIYFIRVITAKGSGIRKFSHVR